MKALFAIILLGGAFLGGYYLGHQRGSPDIFAWARQTANRAGQLTRELSKVTGWKLPIGQDKGADSGSSAARHAKSNSDGAKAGTSSAQAKSAGSVSQVAQARFVLPVQATAKGKILVRIGDKLYAINADEVPSR